MYWIEKTLDSLKKNVYYIFSNILKICLSSSLIMLSSLAQLSAAFSVLLLAVTNFTQTVFQHNKQIPQVTFSGQFRVWFRICPPGSKLIGGVWGLQ